MISLQEFLDNLKEKKVVIWGLGLNQGGLEAAKFFLKRIKAKVVVIDLKDEKRLRASVQEIKKYKNVKFIFGRQEEKDFSGAALIIKNHAIPWEAPLTQKLLQDGFQIETDVTLFFKFFKGKIVGITGSKGKTTTTTLVYRFLRAGGKDVFLGGNVRISLFSFFKKKFLEDRKKIAVFELSSFQLEDLAFVGRSPFVSVITNVLRDHLNRYGTMKNYIKTKKFISLFQKKSDYLILNREDKNSKEFEKGNKAHKIYFSSNPRNILDAEGVFFKRKSSVFWVNKEGKKELGKTKNPFFDHPHNLQSLAIALVVAGRIFKIKKKVLQKEADNFRGVPYRMEKIRVINGVTFYNDTTATIPEATIGNLKTFKNKVILISGGSDKNLKFQKFGRIVAQKVKKVVLLPGNITSVIKEEIKKNSPQVPCKEVKNMREAVNEAYKGTEKGDVVLLSPGCTSFGLFENEFDRGDQFNREVRNLGGKRAG